ncbi:MAG: LptF/LptG family permease [Simkaniaceae bacterium]|nr:LptF/LptG family permease [Simkaniaceae bacterium]
MPILWRYLIKSYLKVFLLCASSFIAILLVTRVQDIARFASLGSKWYSTLQFTLYQIPYMLPIAIAISAFISALILTKKLSISHEFTAMRTFGLSIKEIFFPLQVIAITISIMNFLITSELTPGCRLKSHELINSVTSINPLFLMQKSKLLKLKDSYVDMKMQQVGKEASDVIFLLSNQQHQMPSLILAKRLSIEGNTLIGNNLSYIVHSKGESSDNFPNLLIENEQYMETKASTFASFLQKSKLGIAFEHYPIKPLIKQALINKNIKPKHLKKMQSEICRRFYFPIATFTLTMIGLSFGLHIGRSRRKADLYIALSLSLVVFISFFIGKSFELSPLKAGIAYFLPHTIIYFLCLKRQQRIAGGFE